MSHELSRADRAAVAEEHELRSRSNPRTTRCGSRHQDRTPEHGARLQVGHHPAGAVEIVNLEGGSFRGCGPVRARPCSMALRWLACNERRCR